MATVLVSVLLEQLASVNQEEGLEVVVKEEVQKLTRNLYAIEAVLEDAERRQVMEPIVKRWLDKLKNVCYNTSNVLDEWNTAILKMQIEGNENAPNSKRKVCSFILSYFCCRQIVVRCDIAIKIKELNEILDVIANERHHFIFTLTREYEGHEQQMPTFISNVSEVHGRDQEKNTIVNMLLSENSQGPTLRTISIVGKGGIGKTTLAHLVYEDERVKAHFQKKIWVCAKPFDELRISKEILRALMNNAPNCKELDSLLQCICLSIKGKKFLLILDDVWTEDDRWLEQLKDSLKWGSSGSRILVTTRKETVAKIIRTTNDDMLLLEQLSNKECWSLFKHVAFFGRSNEEYEDLEDIGKRISKKCKGLPFAAKVLGSLLCFKNTRKEWMSVLNSEVWNTEEAKSLFLTLLLSYCDLSSTTRQCFLYCAIFPKDCEIEKDKLIKLWMAEGYLGATDMEVVGEECFEKLAQCSFFQDFKKDGFGTIITFKMHSIMHDFARFLQEKECSVIEVIGPNRLRLNFDHIKVGHSMFVLEGNVSIFAPIEYVKNLRSLIVEYKSLVTTLEVLDQFTCLRSLDLSGCNYYRCSLKKLPKEVGKLIHLRYLNLARNYELAKLPETVCDLCNLQSLNITHCKGLRNLPRGLGKLINLRHLEISSTNVSFMPKGVERLTSLRTLDTFVVSSSDNDSEASNIGDLWNLNQLRGYLEILGLGKVRDVNEFKKHLILAQLKNKEHLIHLALDFSGEKAKERMINDKQVIEALQLPLNLVELSILGYKAIEFPSNWILTLTNLKKLQLCDCWNCELLPPLGKLSSLESLIIGYVNTKNLNVWGGMWSVKRVSIEFLGIETEVGETSSVIVFPKLEELRFFYMENWEEWVTSNIIMPSLCSLEIRSCVNLKALPDYLFCTTSLKELKISRCPILEKRYYKERKGEEEMEGEDWPKISHITNININGKYVQKNEPLMSSFEDSANAMQP